MTNEEQQQFSIMCDTAILFINQYVKPDWMPHWIFKMFHKRDKQVVMLDKAIDALKQSNLTSRSLDEKVNELIYLLFNHYYHLFVRTISHRLRGDVQDALLACLNFSANDVKRYHDMVEEKQDSSAYLAYFKKHHDLEEYRKYFAEKHAVYGISSKYLSKSELDMAAKMGVIQGKLVKRFGMRPMISRTLKLVKNELSDLLNKKVEKGYLNVESIKSYIHKIDLLLANCEDQVNVDDSTILQQARYIIENIVNTAGILPLGPAKYHEHAILIASCYWIDEFLQQLHAEIEI
ncbi:MAG: hypothetical protein AB7F64_08030 [Gammaproteobacteria bacterium]